MKYLATCPISIITTLYVPNQISVIGVNETTLMQLTRVSDRGIHSSSSEIEEGISSVEARPAAANKMLARPPAMRVAIRRSRVAPPAYETSPLQGRSLSPSAFPRHLAVRPIPKLGHAFIRPNHGAIFIIKKRHFKKKFQPPHHLAVRLSPEKPELTSSVIGNGQVCHPYHLSNNGKFN